ncbi:MAG: acyloxyacyl hydrolase [Proteobacteria bacterium]|jgi:hypothetical protein|nr:acyloxyacyl hydrolase [Pseudomonadota bacterium]
MIALRAFIVGCALCAGAAQAATLAAIGGASREASIVGVAWAWHDPIALREETASRLVWGVEADAMNIHSRRGKPLGAADIAAIGVTPNLRVEWPRRDMAPYAGIGVGAHLLSHTQLRGGPSLGTAFQFGEWLEAGLRLGTRRSFEVGLRLEHMSNADIKLPNDGLTFVAVRFGWRF